jgi:hypothetical protein
MHVGHSSSRQLGGVFGALATAAAIAGLGIVFQGSLVAAQQTTVPQRRQPPAAASTKPAGTPQHAMLPVRQVCVSTDSSDTTVPINCTDDIRLPPPGPPMRVGYSYGGDMLGSSSMRSRVGLYFDLSSLNGAELQKATLTVEVKEKKWCGSRIGISAGNFKVSNVKAVTYEPSGPTQTIDVTSLLKPIVANNGRGFGGFVITSGTETMPLDKIKDTCLSTISEARLAVDYVK